MLIHHHHLLHREKLSRLATTCRRRRRRRCRRSRRHNYCLYRHLLWYPKPTVLTVVKSKIEHTYIYIEMSGLQIGYINVCGLMSDKWRASLALLGSGSCDLLFVAETWYVGHDIYSLDRHFITSTTQGRQAKVAAAKGRPSGDMYLLGIAEARGRIHGVPESVGESSITVSTDGGRYVVSGVYMPPSMTPADVQTVLDNLSTTSSVVLGDIDTRFRNKVYQ